MDKYKDRTVLGLTEEINVFDSENNSQKITAKIDTGATKSSIDVELAKRLGLINIIKSKVIRNANGKNMRDIIDAKIMLHGKEITAHFSLADRKEMKYSVLVGQNILRKGDFLIDPQKR